MEREEFEVLLEVVLQAVNEQYVMPMATALISVVDAMRVTSPQAVALLAVQFERLARECPEDVAGRGLLALLAERAARAPTDDSPAPSGTDLRRRLRLVPKP